MVNRKKILKRVNNRNLNFKGDHRRVWIRSARGKLSDRRYDADNNKRAREKRTTQKDQLKNERNITPILKKEEMKENPGGSKIRIIG